MRRFKSASWSKARSRYWVQIQDRGRPEPTANLLQLSNAGKQISSSGLVTGRFRKKASLAAVRLRRPGATGAKTAKTSKYGNVMLTSRYLVPRPKRDAESRAIHLKL